MEANAKRIETIQKWKYNSKDSSIIYPILWKYGVHPTAAFVPHWMSPNIITVFGFMFTVISVFLCYGKTSFSVFEVHIVCWCSFLAFFFDALDGEQGRAWRQEKRDVYVLTQLFDHGFDSLTTILNAYIIAHVLQLDLLGQKLLFLFLISVFLTSTMDYKVKRVLYFGPFNNPTESIFGNIVLLTLSSFFNIPPAFKLYTVGFLLFCTSLANLYTYIGLFKRGNSGERAEVLAIAFFFVTISSCLLSDAPFTLSMIEFAALFHVIELRLICCEIVKENCPKELVAFITPVFLLQLFGVVNPTVHAIVTVLYILQCAWLWYRETDLICQALKMSNAFSMPPINNNPFLKLDK